MYFSKLTGSIVRVLSTKNSRFLKVPGYAVVFIVRTLPSLRVAFAVTKKVSIVLNILLYRVKQPVPFAIRGLGPVT